MNDGEIYQGLAAAHVPNVENVCREALANPRISQLARVPLFLWELAAEVQSGQALPQTRFQLLDRSVARASHEHKEFLTIEGVHDLVPQFLSALARRMTDASLTVLPGDQARKIVVQISKQLQTDGFLSTPPPPPTILHQLVNCHLLFEEDEPASFRFSHQLFQEYFVALDLVNTFPDFPAASFRSWAWSVPIQLGIEALCRQGRNPEAAKFVVRLAASDLEAACRAVGTNPSIWSHLQKEISPKILKLAETGDVNAKWLAARCAAATGQPTFADLVFGGLAGHPPGSGDCYAGLPLESVFTALGPVFADRLLLCDKDDFRLHVLRQLAASGTSDGILLAQKLAVSDKSVAVRQLAFHFLFAARSRGWSRKFISEVRRQGGWTCELLAIAFLCPEVSSSGWCRRVQNCFAPAIYCPNASSCKTCGLN